MPLARVRVDRVRTVTAPRVLAIPLTSTGMTALFVRAHVAEHILAEQGFLHGDPARRHHGRVGRRPLHRCRRARVGAGRYRGAAPFVVLQLMGLTLTILFPELVFGLLRFFRG